MRVVVVFLLAGLLGVQCKSVDVLDARENSVNDSKPEDQTHLHRSARQVDENSVRVMVKYANEQGKEDALAHATRMYHDFDERDVLAIQVDEAILETLLLNPNIESVEDDRVYEEQGFEELTMTQDEHEHRRLQQKVPYGISMIQADQLNVGRYPVQVCVADTGVALNHPDLKARLLTGASRYSSITGAALYWNIDARGHGTHIAGTISARNNGYGVRGIGDIPVYVTRALDDQGLARESDIMAAVQQCGKSGAKVISMSLGGSGMSQAFYDLLTGLYDRGILLVAASGNDGKNSVAWPAAHPRVIGVSAVQEDRSIWSGSNYGSQVELSAPGRMILSTTINTVGQFIYSFYTGTSMATPHVAGAAALVWSSFPQCTNRQIRYALAVTASDAGAAGCDSFFGRGIVQARAAYNWLARNPCYGARWGQNTNPQGGCGNI
ncbi:hypothetical protein MPSEU_000191700 [Mayamaea pseudoterrestris]|nr:hypothetical protein MPSEU_000191700 [Mayamaea pseudoterrestris]